MEKISNLTDFEFSNNSSEYFSENFLKKSLTENENRFVALSNPKFSRIGHFLIQS
jgi:hypothetical protein